MQIDIRYFMRVLSGALRTLKADGLMVRNVYPVVPPEVEYKLTDIGHSPVPFAVQLTESGQTNMKSINTKYQNRWNSKS